MPDWCQNKIIIKKQSGTFKEILDLLNETNEKTLFDRFIPNITDYYKDCGTKWDVSMDEVEFDVNNFDDCSELYIVFNTAWTPCINFCKKISRIFNLRLTLEYDEISQDFCGKIEFNGNNLINEEYYTYWEGMYKINNDFFWDNIDNIPEKERYKL